MKNLNIKLYETDELTDECIKLINGIKNQHWKHTNEEHMKWFVENIRPRDRHLMIYENETKLIAYLDLVRINVNIDKQLYKMHGIGNVCVSKDRGHIGIGTILMLTANIFLKAEKSCGLILCHDKTIKFYERCGWKRLSFGTSFIEGNTYKHNIMLYDPCYAISEHIYSIAIDKSF